MKNGTNALPESSLSLMLPHIGGQMRDDGTKRTYGYLDA
jgi:hypothetical protein